MKKQELVDAVFIVLWERFGSSTTELIYNGPFQLLVSVVLSAQTTDKRVNMITPALFRQYPNAESMSKATAEEILPYIKTVNYANAKSRYLSTTAQRLVEWQKKNNRSIDDIPWSFEELVAFPWVWTKTAKVILNTLFGEKVIAADTHVHRVANRLGLVKTNSPIQTSKQLEKIVPEKYKSFAHHGLIFHGRYTCTARNPKCWLCPFQSFCPYYKNVISKIRGRSKKEIDAENNHFS